MFLNQGEFNGVQILKPETVKMMAGEGISHDSVMRPGSYWGLGMNIKNPLPGAKTGRAKGSFGWSRFLCFPYIGKDCKRNFLSGRLT